MNILYVNEDNHGGGSSIALLHYVNAMKTRGHAVCVLTKEDDGYVIEELRNLGAKVFLCKFRLSYYPLLNNPFVWIKRVLGLLYRRSQFDKVISKIIIEESIDIVHTNVGPLPYALSACKRLHVPHVWHHREYFNKLTPKYYFPYKGCFINQIHSPGNYNICITHGIMDYLHLKEGNSSRVIYDGVINNDEIIDNNKEVQKEKFILFAGSIVKNKAPDMLIRAFSAFHETNKSYKLLIAGRYETDNKYYHKCIKLLDEYNIRDCTEILGYRKDVKELMSKATAIVVPTIYEGFGFTMVEGMLSKTLLIGYNTTGTKEQFDLGLVQSGEEIGLRFSNTKELVDALEYAVTHDTTDMINRAYKVVCNNYTVERCVNETEEFYKFVIDDYKKS